MANAPREAWITGVGIVSCLGEGPQAHWQKLMEAHPGADSTTFAPLVVHPLAPINFDAQIPKKGDQRQMENWQRIGTYAAGLALDSAGVKGKTDILSHMDMIVAAGGGERDLNVDATILSGMPSAANSAAFLNERLMSDLRPTLFLAQLSNLLAGNISIVHGVTGSSRTFMGEETAGIEAVRIALSRIAAGQSDIALVGGSQNAERPDLLIIYQFGGINLKDRYAPVWERGNGGGIAFGSMGAFLVIEAREHAEKRGAKPLARLSAVVSGRANRQPGTVTASLSRLWDKIKDKVKSGHAAVLSGATGIAPATAEERDFLTAHGDLAVRAIGSYLGHGLEPQFPMNVALAALAVGHGSLFPPCDSTGLERPMSGDLQQVLVTGVGHWRGEALALVERVG
ncbi:MAG TPA: beta-ketoacyl-ACP synthase [Pseudolabrys sp.]|nr:beta-ketoacyl-ACP synthase [Pseudolabrys sp.]